LGSCSVSRYLSLFAFLAILTPNKRTAGAAIAVF